MHSERFNGELDRRARELPKGNRQKAAPALALGYCPELPVFDELTSGPDPLMQPESQQLVHELVAQDTTVFLLF